MTTALPGATIYLSRLRLFSDGRHWGVATGLFHFCIASRSFATVCAEAPYWPGLIAGGAFGMLMGAIFGSYRGGIVDAIFGPPTPGEASEDD